MPLRLAPNDDNLSHIPTRKELDNAAEFYFNEAERTVYAAFEDPTTHPVEDSLIDAAQEAIAFAAEFPHLIEKSYKLLIFIEEAFAAAARRQHWLKLYTRMCIAAVNRLESNKLLQQQMVQYLFIKAGSAMAIRIETDRALDLLNEAINYGLDVQPLEWFLARASYLEAAILNSSLEDTVDECQALLNTARQRRDALDELSNPEREAARNDYYEVMLYTQTTLAFTYRYHGLHYDAFVAAQQAFVIAQRLNKPRYMLVTAPYMIDYFRNLRGNNPLSEAITDYCLRLQIPAYAFHAQAMLHMSAAAQHYCNKHYVEAEQHYKNALTMMQDRKDRRDIAMLNHGYGQTLMALERYPEALERIQKAMDEYKTVGLHLYELDATYTLGWIQFMLEDYQVAIETLKEVRSGYEKLPDEKLRAARLARIDTGIARIQKAMK